MSNVQAIDGNFVNKGYCYGLGCKFLHENRDVERQYKRTGKLPIDLAREWMSTQEKLAERNSNICQDQLQSKCFRQNCKFGIHHVFRTDMDAGNIVEFSFRPGPNMVDYIQNIYGDTKPWSSDVLCHIRTPFPLLAEHIINVLRPFRITGNQVSFMYNGQKILHTDTNITPLSLDIGNGVDVFVDIVFAKNSLV
uniref:C3H1-type domain-containing protein n=1 Tax=Tetranychus urticae TaxID=32264 RepID=T1JRN7_TETUR